MGLICTPYGYSGAARVSGLAYRTVILGDKPVAYWPLNETSGTVANDLSGNSFNMAYQNAPTLGAAAIAPGLGKSVALNGSSQYVELASPPTALQLVVGSFEIWCNQTTINYGAALFCNYFTGSAINFSIGQGGAYHGPPQTGNLFGGAFNGSAWTLVGYSSALPVNSAHHIVYTNDGTTAKLYINGSLAFSGTGPNFTPNGNAIQIGASPGVAQFVNGLLSNAAIYNTALTAQQILNHYNAGTA